MAYSIFLKKEAVGKFTADVDSLILVNADPVFAFAEISQPVQGSLHETQDEGVGNEVYDAAMHEGMGSEPVPPDRKQAVFLVMNFAISVLAVAHGLRLQHEVCEGVAE